MDDRPLAAKLAEVMGEISGVKKAGFNDHFKYSFATEADVSTAVRNLLAERGVAVLPQVGSDPERLEIQTAKGTRYVTQFEVGLTFTDGKESLRVSHIGQGEDSGDKGANKALTAGVKYALMKTFLIPTGEDPDADAPSKPSQPKWRKELDAVLEQLSPDQIAELREIAEEKGWPHRSELTQTQASEVIATVVERFQ